MRRAPAKKKTERKIEKKPVGGAKAAKPSSKQNRKRFKASLFGKKAAKAEPRDAIRTVFDLESVSDPLVGTPAEVQKELDGLALAIQRNPNNKEAFLKIVTYMHKYILGLVFKKYSFVKGYEDNDMYQEALIALFKKAIPSFKTGMGMSFLNFSKMCINRHLITILNSSRNRKKDVPMNTAISLDHGPSQSDPDDDCQLSNVITDENGGKMPFEHICSSESMATTVGAMKSKLSGFEWIVLMEYLKELSYSDIARNIRRAHAIRCNEKSIDNALLRIRKKACQMKDEFGDAVGEMLPILSGA